ncbi:hypothetical protein SKAU_G00365580 [Synaphobranchus kaupii]|uniref:Ig-like domain-containing protein n=1 Tax=Synaphobranchus kaupii TaxID=118154 RepID=A0A9Q1IFA2_SYNKA|nr:hypothetical protein SKAU_G00365580 [Synaphobranchus kaupii]
MRHNNITVSGNRTSVLSNGTLQLHNINKYDGGVYKMEGHDAVGKCLVREHIWLEVQDPVSHPKVSVSCKGGRLDLRCEAERGDNVSFRWATLGGSVNASLGVTHLLSLEGSDQQELVCVASNMVSTETSDPLKPDCRETWIIYTTLWPFIGGDIKTVCRVDEAAADMTLRLDNLTKDLSGRYSVEVYYTNGKFKEERDISLTIQDPVTPPQLSQDCLLHGEIEVSCSSTGEDPQYSWTLEDRPLDGSVAILSDETQTVIMRRSISGPITCAVRNRVSSAHTTQELRKCPGNGIEGPREFCLSPGY